MRTGFKLTELKHKLKYIGIKHVNVEFDCCFAGGIFVDRGVPEESGQRLLLDRLINAPVVDATTAVTADEVAIEDSTTGHGLFTHVWCELLASGRIFEMHDRPWVTSTELFERRSAAANMSPPAWLVSTTSSSTHTSAAARAQQQRQHHPMKRGPAVGTRRPAVGQRRPAVGHQADAQCVRHVTPQIFIAPLTGGCRAVIIVT